MEEKEGEKERENYGSVGVGAKNCEFMENFYGIAPGMQKKILTAHT